MSHYVMSDIHGELDRFHTMLKTIGFSENDTLYILGDVVDRGPDGIPLLMEIMKTPNMKMLLGNHEYMCLQYHSPEATDVEFRRWNKNGNGPTLAGLARLTEEERKELFTFLYSLPTHLELTVNGKGFYLVHGLPAGNVHDEVWFRPHKNPVPQIPGRRIIIGHSPVSCLGRTDEEEAAYVKEIEAKGEKFRIYHCPEYIDIDCCCGYDFPVRQLACLRLEDMEEFYV